MKNIIAFISFCILAFASCTKSYEAHYDFGFDREELRFAAKDTASYFMVYGEGDWTLRMSREVSWVSIDKYAGKGTTQVNVRIQQNEGVARDVEVIAAYQDGREKPLVLSQEAKSSSMKAYSLSSSELNLLKVARDLKIPATAGFKQESMSDLKYWVEYESEEKDWIENLSFNYENATFSVKENTSAAERTAHVYWTFPVAHWEVQDTLSAKIVQTSLLPSLELEESYSLDSEGIDSLRIVAKINWDKDIYDFDLSCFTVSEGVRGSYSESGNYLALITDPNTSRDVYEFELKWSVMDKDSEVSSCSTRLIQNYYIPPTDLTPDGEYANCYVLKDKEEAYYSVDVFLVSGMVPAEDIVSASVLWETSFGMITKCSYDADKNKLYVGKAKNALGNAVIALKNADGLIRWSYHFWMTNTDAPLPEITVGGFGFMDRNVGAIANTAPVDGESDAAGLYYQWGRKDPFPPTTNLKTANGVISKVYPSGAVIFTVAQKGVTLKTSIENPATFYWGNDNSGAEDWCSTQSDEYWNTKEKTDMDPCPYGYVVPDQSQLQILNNAYLRNADYGNILKCDDGTENYISSAGWMRRKLHDTSQYAHIGQHPHCWSTTAGKVDDDCWGSLSIDKINTVLKANARRWGGTVRCVKQTKTQE